MLVKTSLRKYSVQSAEARETHQLRLSTDRLGNRVARYTNLERSIKTYENSALVRFDSLKASHILHFVISISKAEDKERKEAEKKRRRRRRRRGRKRGEKKNNEWRKIDESRHRSIWIVCM